MLFRSVPGVSHQWAGKVGEELVDEFVWLAKDTIIVNMVVKHQSKGASIPHCKDGMRNGMPPMKVVEEVYRTWKQNRKVHSQMSDEYGVRVLSYKTLRKLEVWLGDISIKSRMQLVLLPHCKDPSLLTVLLQEWLHARIVILMPLSLLLLSLARVADIVPYIVMQVSEDCLISFGQV